MEGLSFNQVSLIRDPGLLNLNDFIFKLLCLLENVVLFGFHWSRVFFDTSVHQLGILSVKLVYLELLLVDSVVSFFDVDLETFNFLFLFFQLTDQIVKFFLKEVILLDTVKVIDSHSRNFIGKILNIDLLL